MQMQKHDLHYNFFGPKPAKLSFINFTVDWQLKYTHGGTIILCPWKIHFSWKSFWRHVSGNLQPLVHFSTKDILEFFILFSGIQLLHGQHVHGSYLRPVLPRQVQHYCLHSLFHAIPFRGDILLWKEEPSYSVSWFKLLPKCKREGC